MWPGFDGDGTGAQVSGWGSVTSAWGLKPVSVIELFLT